MKKNNLYEHYPTFTGENWKRVKGTYAAWQEWCKSHGAYGFRAAPYPFCIVCVIGDERYLETLKAMYGINYVNSYADSAGGLVTQGGFADGHKSMLTVMLQEGYDEEILWHEALHVALMVCEYVGISLHEQEALTYLQGYVAEHLKKAFLLHEVAKKTKNLKPVHEIYTGDAAALTVIDAGCVRGRRYGR
ncbi:hypothetical protein L9H26_18805 [Morganella psychrotolerans]|uniref:Uncharacterized protein n=1 Tax=Morganella psychrotolerans TaxID=368603 RepID=A0A5M9QXB3_9GAMM|nr:hypothetical protein [Morganella psychrotolerans]KAA8713060.1 hypothetical protein F4V73_18270 [Morganella psychrotolerans]OBU01943.1 hypothetical protein AYY16_17195 [Morganella psychrotolerans]